jgi:hypothetical protein
MNTHLFIHNTRVFWHSLGAHKPIANWRRLFSVKTPREVIDGINLSAHKIICLQRENNIPQTIPQSSEWDSPSTVRLTTLSSHPAENSRKVHYYCGGLPALMQAARKLDQIGPNLEEPVVYTHDGKIQKTTQSGHQGHVHPSEWAADDCKTVNLLKVMFRGMGVLSEISPTDLKHYSYLHFPINWKQLFATPWQHAKLYGAFFQQRVLHNLKAINGVSTHDRWLCDTVRESLMYHQRLSDRIEAETGTPTFKRGFRVYWSPDLGAMEKKKATWNALGIDCAFLTEREIMESTLLKANAKLYVLKIFGDGKFYPGTPGRIAQHLLRHFPNFSVRQAKLSELYVNAENQPIAVRESSLEGTQSITPVKSFFGSPGHSDVFHYNPKKAKWHPLWQEVPVSGVSATWRCVVSKKEMQERLGVTSPSEIRKSFHEIVAAANLSNLHATSWDCEVEGDNVIILVRASQGANFNAMVANKNDLLNMYYNLNHYFIGDWELLSVGTCTRKTWVSNVPEFQNGFLHGLSGIGYSFSATPFEMLQKPPL